MTIFTVLIIVINVFKIVMLTKVSNIIQLNHCDLCVLLTIEAF